MTVDTAEEMNSKVQLLDLIQGLVMLTADESKALMVEVSGVSMDSRGVGHGDLFIACFGTHHDARDYIVDAIGQGAAAVLAESSKRWQGLRTIDGVPVIAVDALAAKMSLISSRFYSDPSTQLTVIGITGTNGKTSCSQFIAQILNEMNHRCGIIGTLGYGSFGDLKQTHLTTPDAVFTQAALAEMLHRDLDPVVMEVSSVGLHQHRVAAVHFDTAIFTNLSRDHLDYHANMEDYASSKRKLFTMEGLRCAIVNLDDPYALSMLNAVSSDVEVLTYSCSNRSASVYAANLQFTETGYSATINTPLGCGHIAGALLGAFNFSNVLAVASAVIAYLGETRTIAIDELCRQLSALRPVKGRMELIGQESDITAVVDYAHTPEGLRSALVALRQHFNGKIWCVFGCGGNRDKGKRPLMGEVAERYANRLIITDDNPRYEDANEIVQHIRSGIGNKAPVTVIRDRAAAIDYAVANAESDDVVLVAGKGHESSQEINGEKYLFSDANQVRLAIHKRNGSS